MKNTFNGTFIANFLDSIYLIDTEGGTPILDDGTLVSDFYTENHFARLSNYQLSQWVDVNSTDFVNFCTIPFTSNKYMYMGKSSLTAGNYQMVVKNNFPKNSEITKTLIV
jgi:hypothetical protein